MMKRRGVAAHHYIMFLRLYLQLAGVFCFISGMSLSINISQDTDLKISFDSTTSNSIPPNSDLNWINLVISFFVPWLVVYMVRKMSKNVGHLKPLTKTFNRTLLIESSSCAFDKDKVVEYFVQKYTDFELINVIWSPSTHNLQELCADLNLTEDILEFCGEEENKLGLSWAKLSTRLAS